MSEPEKSALDAFEEQYGGAPAWYWRIQMWLGGWKGEVEWWVALFLFGIAFGMVVGFIGGLTV